MNKTDTAIRNAYQTGIAEAEAKAESELARRLAQAQLKTALGTMRLLRHTLATTPAIYLPDTLSGEADRLFLSIRNAESKVSS